jgi:citrate lyase gamma subunit
VLCTDVSLDTASLPDDVSLLKAMLVVADAELEQLRMQVAKLRRMQFGASSERLIAHADQLELGLEDAEVEAVAKVLPAVIRARDAAKSFRQHCTITCRAMMSCTRPPACVRTAAARCDASART